MKYVQFYKTKDRFEIYTLLASGCTLDGYEPDGRGSIYFRFTDKDKCLKVLSELLSKKLRVNMNNVINAIRDTHAIFTRK